MFDTDLNVPLLFPSSKIYLKLAIKTSTEVILAISLSNLNIPLLKKILRVVKACANPLSVNHTKWSNNSSACALPTNFLSVFDYFVGLAPKDLKTIFIHFISVLIFTLMFLGLL